MSAPATTTTASSTILAGGLQMKVSAFKSTLKRTFTRKPAALKLSQRKSWKPVEYTPPTSPVNVVNFPRGNVESARVVFRQQDLERMFHDNASSDSMSSESSASSSARSSMDSTEQKTRLEIFGLPSNVNSARVVFRAADLERIIPSAPTPPVAESAVTQSPPAIAEVVVVPVAATNTPRILTKAAGVVVTSEMQQVLLMLVAWCIMTVITHLF